MEFVFVVPRSELFRDCYPQGLLLFGQQFSRDEFESCAATQGFYVERARAEREPAWKQIIPYAVVVRGGDVLLMKRLRKGGEGRLFDKLSIGVGGHINPVDQPTASATGSAECTNVASTSGARAIARPNSSSQATSSQATSTAQPCSTAQPSLTKQLSVTAHPSTTKPDATAKSHDAAIASSSHTSSAASGASSSLAPRAAPVMPVEACASASNRSSNSMDARPGRALPLQTGTLRELSEELEITGPCAITSVGILNDDSNPVGAVHLGLVQVVTLMGDARIREKDVLEGSFTSTSELRALQKAGANLESWSKVLVERLDELLAAARPADTHSNAAGSDPANAFLCQATAP